MSEALPHPTSGMDTLGEAFANQNPADTAERQNPPISPTAERLRSAADRIEKWRMGKLHAEAIKENDTRMAQAQDEVFDTYEPNLLATANREADEHQQSREQRIESTKNTLRNFGRAALLPFTKTFEFGRNLLQDFKANTSEIKGTLVEDLNNRRSAAQTRKAERRARREKARDERLDRLVEHYDRVDQRRAERKAARQQLYESAKGAAGDFLKGSKEQLANTTRNTLTNVGELAILAAGAVIEGGRQGGKNLKENSRSEIRRARIKARATGSAFRAGVSAAKNQYRTINNPNSK